MYNEYWGFKEKPFQNTPDPRFFYKSSEHEEALMKMLYTVEEGLGGGMLTGVFGCGKTVIGQALLEQLPDDKYKIAFIVNPQLEYVELLRAIVRNLKSVELPAKKTELSTDSLLEILGNILENNVRDGKETVVIIDEAHIIKDESMFEELRLLLNFQRRDKFLLTLLLFGQPELKQRIEDNKQLEQRIAIKSHLEAFSREDTRNYIIHRLYVAAKADSVFDESAFKIIHDRSGGIPRRINRICDLSLLVGLSKDIKSINKDMVEEALQTIGG
ncbi:MAG: AAA family ATPase [Candidatus Omnitrophota bacterium]|nr:AAA family ATPase [Candidatus Omnitrophota bacterium]